MGFKIWCNPLICWLEVVDGWVCLEWMNKGWTVNDPSTMTDCHLLCLPFCVFLSVLLFKWSTKLCLVRSLGSPLVSWSVIPDGKILIQLKLHFPLSCGSHHKSGFLPVQVWMYVPLSVSVLSVTSVGCLSWFLYNHILPAFCWQRVHKGNPSLVSVQVWTLRVLGVFCSSSPWWPI